MPKFVINFYAAAETGELQFIANAKVEANTDLDAAEIARNELLPTHPEIAQNYWLSEGPAR